jgi:hypothetical protein
MIFYFLTTKSFGIEILIKKFLLIINLTTLSSVFGVVKHEEPFSGHDNSSQWLKWQGLKNLPIEGSLRNPGSRPRQAVGCIAQVSAKRGGEVA